jgi:hypothetical protein
LGHYTTFIFRIRDRAEYKSYSGGQALPDCQAEPDLQ